MTRLGVLNISENTLRDLPVSLGYCEGLGNINGGIFLDGNPISNQALLDKSTLGRDHLFDYLEKRLANFNTPKLARVTFPTLADDFVNVASPTQPTRAANSALEGQVLCVCVRNCESVYE